MRLFSSGFILSCLLGMASFTQGEPSLEYDWNSKTLLKPPRVFPVPDAPAYHEEGVRGIFFEGMPYRGKPTRVYAWYGAPKLKPGEKAPAVVLAHGGGGTAFAEWVRVWNRRGYAALSLALEGQAPGEKDAKKQWPRHPWSGPKRPGFFTDMDQPAGDQWLFHAVADVMLAQSLLQRVPEVDANRIGLTGISWGGILSSAAAGIDSRFKFVVPVYGCGFLYETPLYSRQLRALGEARRKKYIAGVDPANFLPDAAMPMLWVNGANDVHFPLNAHGKSCRATKGPSTACVRVGMGHSHRAGWAPKEIYVFADSIFRNGLPLACITGQGREDRTAWVTFESEVPIKSAELNYTTDVKDWVTCEWITDDAVVQDEQNKVTVSLPVDCAAWFINLIDKRGLVVSSIRETMPKEMIKKVVLGPIAPGEVRITRRGRTCEIRTQYYEARVDGRGNLARLATGEDSFFLSNQGIARGLYFYQKGRIDLARVKQTSEREVGASSDKAATRYEFGERSIKCSRSNKTDTLMSNVIVFEKTIRAVSNGEGEFSSLPTRRPWKTTVWYGKKQRLKIAGGTNTWGPWNGGHQVWIGNVDAQKTSELIFEISSIPKEEEARLEAFSSEAAGGRE